MMKKFAILMISIVTAFASFGPAQAFPGVSTPTTISASDVQQVRDSRHIRRHDRRSGNRWEGGHNRRDRYNDRRYGRRNNTGAIIGGVIASQNRNGSSCASRYRSYRASDNTYQPNSGPRRVCR